MIRTTSCKALSLFVILAFLSSKISAQMHDASASLASPLSRSRRLTAEATDVAIKLHSEATSTEKSAEQSQGEPVEALVGAKASKTIRKTPLQNTNIAPQRPNTEPQVAPATFTGSNTNSSNDPEGTNLPMAKIIKDLLDDYRVSLGLSKLAWGDSMYAPTLDHTQYQVDRRMISHDGFDVRADRCSTSAENVAMFGGETVSDNDGAAKFMKMWRESPGHDANMRNGSVSQVSIAVIFCKTQQAYYSTMFLFKP